MSMFYSLYTKYRLISVAVHTFRSAPVIYVAA